MHLAKLGPITHVARALSPFTLCLLESLFYTDSIEDLSNKNLNKIKLKVDDLSDLSKRNVSQSSNWVASRGSALSQTVPIQPK